MQAPIAEGNLVSVIIRTKDRPRLLGEAVASVAAQTHQPVEAIVVNDGGVDVGSVVGAFGGRLDCRLVNLRPGRGRSAAANAGVAAARGAWVGFLDDDDLLLPDAVATLLDATGGGGGVPYGRVDAYFHPEGEPPRLFRVFSRPFDPDALLFENFIPVNACLIPAGVLRDIGGMDERLECFEDWDLFLRLSDRLPFRHVDRQVAEYRIFDQAFITGRGGQERQHQGRVAIFSKHAHRYTAEALSRMQYAVKTAAAVTDVVTVELESRLRQREAELAAAANDLAQLSGRLATAEGALRAIESSLGWRFYQRLRRMLGRR
ncbi:MAG: glycosyltransferase family 2 protein [Thermoanaerobaculaceae bacterium]|nr:glycosyltransferase family 2 protein [Thermoanaerobaculaceae bacterium]